MVAREFLQVLRFIRPGFGWGVTRTGAIRGHSPQVRGVQFDPIRAVAFVRTGEVFPDSGWLDAARSLELPWIDAGLLAAAATQRLTFVQPDSETAELRRRMLATLELDDFSRRRSLRALGVWLRDMAPLAHPLRGHSSPGD